MLQEQVDFEQNVPFVTSLYYANLNSSDQMYQLSVEDSLAFVSVTMYYFNVAVG